MIATLRAKNQITLPARLVKDVGLTPGDIVNIREEGGSIVISGVHVDSDWLSDEVLAEIDEAAKGLFVEFSSDVELEAYLRG